MRQILILIVFAFLAACSVQSNRDGARVVSLVQIIASPELYIGSRVSFVGFLSRFQSIALVYLTEDHADFEGLSSAIPIDMNLESIAEDRFDQYVAATGRLRIVNGTMALTDILWIYGDRDEMREAD